MKQPRTAAFTLIEVLAVLFLTAVVIGVALNFFVNLTNQSARATETTRSIRRATSLLDRVAREFERTILVTKPEETDPLAHPFIFLAESRNSNGGSDRVKFVTRRSPEGRFDAPRSDLSMVSFFLQQDADGRSNLIRSTGPLPEQLDRDFPLDNSLDLIPLAEDVELFRLRFLSAEGEWQSEWDSSQLLDSSTLPVAVEIEVALADDSVTETESDEFDLAEPITFKRRVMLPLRPIDIVALFDPDAARAGGEGSEEDADGDGIPDDPSGGRSIAQCLNNDVLRQQGDSQGGLAGLTPAEAEAIRQLVEGSANTPFREIADLYCGHPAVKPECC